MHKRDALVTIPAGHPQSPSNHPLTGRELRALPGSSLCCISDTANLAGSKTADNEFIQQKDEIHRNQAMFIFIGPGSMD